jgi:cellulose synthase operon protein C
MTSKAYRALTLLAALTLAACGSSAVKDAAPPIGKTIGKLDEPSPDVLPIIPSEPIATDPSKAVENYRKLLELAPDPETKAEAQRRLADLQVQIEDSRGVTEDTEKSLQEAIGLYNKLLYADPLSKENDRIFYQMARAQQNLGETEAAIDTLRRLTERHPDSPLVGDARFRRAELLFNLRRYAEAESEYKLVMDLADATPFFEPAQYKYGWSQYKQSKYEEAIATFFDVLERELPPGEQFEPEPALAAVAKEKNELVRDSLRVITLALGTLGGGPALSEYLAEHGDPRFAPLVYAALGEAFLEKERYTDAAGAYAAFIERYPASPGAPAFQSRVIAAYGDGGFRDLVIEAKERYATTYDPGASYWGGQPATPEVLAELRTHLDDLAKHYHARAQQDKAANQADFLVAARWYRRIIELYPQDAQLAEVNFLLGDALLDGGRTLEAAREYEHTAYAYKPHRRAGEAAHASVLAFQKHASAVGATERPAALTSAIDASIKLADTFPAHPQKYPVLTQTAQDLFELKAYDRAVETARRVLDAERTVDARLRRIAWSVSGDAPRPAMPTPKPRSARSSS